MRRQNCFTCKLSQGRYGYRAFAFVSIHFFFKLKVEYGFKSDKISKI